MVSGCPLAGGGLPKSAASSGDLWVPRVSPLWRRRTPELGVPSHLLRATAGYDLSGSPGELAKPVVLSVGLGCSGVRGSASRRARKPNRGHLNKNRKGPLCYTKFGSGVGGPWERKPRSLIDSQWVEGGPTGPPQPCPQVFGDLVWEGFLANRSGRATAGVKQRPTKRYEGRSKGWRPKGCSFWLLNTCRTAMVAGSYPAVAPELLAAANVEDRFHRKLCRASGTHPLSSEGLSRRLPAAPVHP